MPVAQFKRILVPMKLGVIGEEMLATAVKLASRARGGGAGAARDPRARSSSRSTRRCIDEEERAEASLAEAKLLGADFGVDRRGRDRPRAGDRPGDRRAAVEVDADLIVLGSAPRWRRQSRFFSPTVDYVLRRAPCEVLIVAFPQTVMDEELAHATLSQLPQASALLSEYAAPL